MANWFKLYETDLDESRLKYALSKLPEVGWVWVGILSECCKHRSDTIRWSEKAHELFGFSDRLKVSIGKITEAINLLVEIEYIERGQNTLKVLKWNEKQSEYNHRKQRGDYQNIGESRIISDKSVISPLEEKRREEIRREGTGAEVASLPAPKASKFRKPTEQEVRLQCAKIGLEESEADKFMAHYESNGWRVGRNPMKSWTHALTNWKLQSPNFQRNGSNQPETKKSHFII